MTTHEQLLALIKRKDEMEAEILGIVDELQSTKGDGPTPVGLKGNLVDKDGFPRNDIDIMRITSLRNRHAILNTDLAEIMKQIESGLYALHANAPKPESTTETLKKSFDEPFLRVNTCEANSPAYESGLRAGDLITKFGSLVAGEFSRDGFPSVAAQVAEGKPMRVYVQRDGQQKTFTLTPKNWSGQGLLGCHLVKS